MRRRIVSRAKAADSEATRSAIPLRAAFLLVLSLRPIEGGPVLDGFRPRPALSFLVRPPSRKVVAIPHIAVARTGRRAFGLSLRLCRFTRWSYRCSRRRPPLGDSVSTTVGIVERFVDRRR